MPAPVTNNAVTSVQIGGKHFVYSFGGLDATKLFSGINLRSFKYDVSSDQWSELPSLPDTLGKIASAASTVKGKIYIIGGYHVYENRRESSSNKVHIFDPETDTFLPDGASLPVPIDDHVQAVWEDKLIYVISGWSNTENVNNVQIYDPAGDKWMEATPVADVPEHKVFGSQGTIIGNKIYYAGGAGNRENNNYPVKTFLRIGEIDPNDPTQIHWTSFEDVKARIYRPGAAVYNNMPLWIGGSSISYNYNGISYTGVPVKPLLTGIYYDTDLGVLIDVPLRLPQVMDLRGIASIGNNKYIIAGGILPGQIVSNKTYLIQLK